MAIRVHRPLLFLAVLALLPLMACKPDPRAKEAQWNAAVGQRSGATAWQILDSATRHRIVEGLKRSQAKAKTDPDFQRLFAGACAPADSAQPPEALAQALLADPELAFPAEDAVSATWPPEPVGLCTPDGCPLTLALRTHPPEAPTAGTSFHLVVDPDGKTDKEVHQAYAAVIRDLAPRQHWSPACAAQATRILGVYFDEMIPRGAFKVTFEMGGDAGLTAVFDTYNASTRRTESKPEPRLAYTTWP